MKFQRSLVLLALILWILSLVLPVFGESWPEDGYVYIGVWAIVFTFTWGIMWLAGLPWAFLNVGLFYIAGRILFGNPPRRFGKIFLIILFFVTLVTVLMGMDWPALGWMGGRLWRVGVLPWLASMYLVAYASLYTAENRSELKLKKPEVLPGERGTGELSEDS